MTPGVDLAALTIRGAYEIFQEHDQLEIENEKYSLWKVIKTLEFLLILDHRNKYVVRDINIPVKNKIGRTYTRKDGH